MHLPVYLNRICKTDFAAGHDPGPLYTISEIDEDRHVGYLPKRLGSGLADPSRGPGSASSGPHIISTKCQPASSTMTH